VHVHAAHEKEHSIERNILAAVIVRSKSAHGAVIMPTGKKLAISSIASVAFLAASFALTAKAEAGSNISFSFGFSSPVYEQPYYAPPPVYYAPPPLVYAPAPAYYYAPPRVYYPPVGPGFYGPPPGNYRSPPFYGRPRYYREDDD
jgi:hypothetical protein